MRDHLGTLVQDFRRADREIAIVRYQGIRRRVATYGDIARLAARFAAFLAQHNIVAGDRVVLWAENSAEWIAAFHGCILRGVLVVPLDAYGSPDFAARVAADVQPKLAVGDSLMIRQLSAIPLHLAFEDWPAALPTEEAGPIPTLNRHTPLQILFTSGTTGDPKGIVHTHGNVLSSIAPIEDGAQPYLRFEKYVHPLRFLHTLPLSHVFGQTMGLWIPPIFRAQVHFESRLVAPHLIETIRRERISVFAAVPRVFALLKTHLELSIPGLTQRLAAAQSQPPGKLGWRRWVHFRDVHRAFGFKFWALISGGGALPPAVEHFWNSLAFVLVQGYGMTETTALITLNHPFHVAHGTIGKPLPGREVKIGSDGEVLVRGPMISTSTWSGGQLHQRSGDWLATGDLAETQSTGELKFLGRKSETIVTGAGLNIHPEDLEAVLEDQPGIAACAVVAIDTPSGPEPCAVLALRGPENQAPLAVDHANQRLADFQRIRRWVLYPEPDLPRTSTGKVRRRAVAQWLAQLESASHSARPAESASFSPSSDWLLQLIAQITGEAPHGIGDELRLDEDLHLDSLGRVQLAAAIEQKLGMPPESGLLEEAQTLGDLRALLSGKQIPAPPGLPPETLLPSATKEKGHDFSRATIDPNESSGALAPEVPPPTPTHEPASSSEPSPSETVKGTGFSPYISPAPKEPGALAPEVPPPTQSHEPARPSDPSPSEPVKGTGFSPYISPAQKEPGALAPEGQNHLYPHWPWSAPIQFLRTAFLELIELPLVRLLAAPRITRPTLHLDSPVLIIANHISAYDGPLIQYALPPHIRRRIAAAMSGEMLLDFRRFRHPDRPGRFYPLGPAAWFLATALFNVFPLPRTRDFQRSFAHAGQALDRGYHVLVFPEGARSPAGQLARFRPGIGILVKQARTAVLPIALRGLGDLKSKGKGWFRSGKIEIKVGEPLTFPSEATESEITAHLHAAVEALLRD